MSMKTYKYVKSNAFTQGNSLGNPAASIYTGSESLSPEQMLAIAKEHQGFVMEMVYCENSTLADCKLTYYSSECEVDFCGHGTIATMYSFLRDNEALLQQEVITAETHRKGVINIYNRIQQDDAVFVEAPDPIEYKVSMSAESITHALRLPEGSIEEHHPIRLIDAGLRTLIVPIRTLEAEISVYPDIDELKQFALDHEIDIFLLFSMEVNDVAAFAHTRVFAPKYGYLEDPATGSGNSAFANYLLREGMWDGKLIAIEQGGNDRIYNAVKLKTQGGKVLFGGRATVKIEGSYIV